MLALFEKKVVLTRILAWSMSSLCVLVSIPVQAGNFPVTLPLGEARGLEGAQVAVDGKNWTELTAVAEPVFKGSKIKTGGGVAFLSLGDGTLLELRRDTEISLDGLSLRVEMRVSQGHLLFRMPADSKMVLSTTAGKLSGQVLSPVRPISMAQRALVDRVGALVVDKTGVVQIRALQGNLIIQAVDGSSSSVLKAGEGVTLGAPKEASGRILVAQRVLSTVTPPPTQAPPEGFQWGWDADEGKWVPVRAQATGPNPPIQIPPEGYKWGYEPNLNRWILVPMEVALPPAPPRIPTGLIVLGGIAVVGGGIGIAVGAAKKGGGGGAPATPSTP